MKLTFSLVLSILILGLNLTSAQDNKLSRTGTGNNFKNTPISYFNTESILFSDNMNASNTIAGLQSRGWIVLNEDGGGTTDAFYQGNSGVFPAYEGPDTGYVASNYNGANGFLINHWLISPPITVNVGDTLSFWHRSPDGNAWDDSIYVRYSTTAGTIPSAFDVTWGRYLVSESGWARWTGTFQHSGTIRFAIQYYLTDGGPSGNHSNYMGLDLIQVISGPAMGGPFLVENFDYPVGDSLGAHGWNWHSGTGTTILVTAGSLSYAGYPESGIGNSTTLFGGSGSREDMNRLFTSVTTGSVYAAVLVNVQAAATTGDYFLHYSTNPHTTSFRGRVFVKDNGAGAFQFGLSKASTSTVVYTSGTYNYNTTYLLVLKYEVVTDVTGSDDLVKLYINPVLSNPEPVSADLTNTDTGSDIGVGAIDIRQGAQAYTVQLDGIRIGTTWFDVVPVELTSFTASVANGSVRLNWTTATEVNNAGFEVERRSVNNDWQKIGYVSGSGTTTESRSYSFIDNNLNAGQYSYRLKQVDYNGTFEYSNEINVEVTSPVAFDLSQNYPNPFNPATKINFSLPAAGNVKLAVFNLLGEEVATLVNGFRAAGTYSVDFNAANLNSGLYFYRLETENFSKTMKMTLLK